jgi:plastocyanin
VVVTAGCGAGTPASRPTPTGGGTHASGGPCVPDGIQLHVVVQAVQFDTKCLAAPAEKPFTIEFEDRDDFTRHNFTIAEEGVAKPLFQSEIVQGPRTVTFRVEGIPSGTYLFFCIVHPAHMSGTFVAA